MCHGQARRVFLGMGDLPTLNDGILISWGPINPNGLGLMSLSVIPYYMGNNGSLDPIAHVDTSVDNPICSMYGIFTYMKG